MFRTLFAGAVLAATLALSAAGAQAAPVSYEFDKVHTQIIFSVNHLGFSHSTGRFQNFDGSFTYDAENIANSAVEVQVHADSLFLGTEAWDKHVKSADFLNAEQFPLITFKSTSIEQTGENTANITGDLTILGVTKPVVLAATLNKAGKHPMSGKDHIGVSATTTIKRSEFGMNYGIPNVGDDVSVRIEVEGSAAAPAADGAADAGTGAQ
jgi:polyisoprenoid-binding protein YceI